MHLLVVNADDFGYSDERDAGIVECYRKGHISSVSLLVNGVSAENAVKLAKKYDIPTGLHVNLTEGCPLGRTYRTLTRNGYMLGKYGFRKAIIDGIVDTTEVRQEIQCQMDKYRDLMGEIPYHADGHQHINVIPDIVETFATVLQENGVTVSRLPIERNVVKDDWPTTQQAEFKMELIKQTENAKEVYSSHNIWTCDRFMGLRTMGSSMTVDKVKAHLSDVFDVTCTSDCGTPNGKSSEGQIMTCEWMVHPGHVTLGDGGCGEGPDEFAQSHEREHEISILANQSVRNVYKTLNITMTNFSSCVAACT